MLKKSLYDSWASRIRLFIKGKKHGRMMLDSIDNGQLVYPTVKENGQTRPMKYSELTEAQQLQDDYDVQATNIIFTGETLYEYYWRFSQLINDMHTIGMTMQQVQVNTKFLNALLSEWSKFVTDVKLAKSLYNTNYDQLYAYLSQHERHANEVHIMRDRYLNPLTLVANSLTLYNSSQSPQPSDCDDLSSAKAKLMENLSSCDPEVLFELFEINELKAQSQEKDTVIRNLKNRIKSLMEKEDLENVKKDIDEIETINIELEYNLNAQLQEKVFAITTLKNKLRKLKGKNVVDTVVSKSNATIALGMFKLDIEPLSLRLKNNKDVHEVYIEKTIKYTDTLRGFAKRARTQNPSRTFTIVGNRCSLTRITSTKGVPPKETSTKSVATPTQGILVYSRRPQATRSVVQIVLWYLDFGCSKHMTENLSQFINFVSKSLGTVRFGNDHSDKIISYGDNQMGNVTISQVYYVEGVGHKLFSAGQFYDSDLEVAFRKHACFIRDLDDVDLLKGSQGSNLYTLSMDNLLLSSPICLLSKASKTKSLLWHRRLSYLNFTISILLPNKCKVLCDAVYTSYTGNKVYYIHIVVAIVRVVIVVTIIGVVVIVGGGGVSSILKLYLMIIEGYNTALPAAQGDAQSWKSDLARQTDARSSFNELLDTPIDFSNFIMQRLNVDTLTPDLLVGPTYELMRGSCSSLTELEYHLEEIYKATTDQLDWVNPEGQQYPHNLLQRLPLIPDNRGRR
nr:integrase, catalytic region, zinc finger, CCHC-type, peptidase aspartic, catalytic [Tanacetum cinerariifolium]